MENTSKVCCPCSHHKVMPVLMILFGAIFLLGNWNILSWSLVNTLWPILVIVAGAMKWTEKTGMCKCC